MSLTIKEQFAQMKSLVVNFGATHEAHHLQLKRWPLMIPGVSKLEKYGIDVDSKMVVFYCDAKRFRRTAKVKKAFEEVTRWVRLIMWDETVVSFVVNGKIEYDTRT